MKASCCKKNFFTAPQQATYARKNNFLSAMCVYVAFSTFVFLSTEKTLANLQGLTHLTPSKGSNQVTLCNKHIISSGRSLT